jgi:hypothetical protein
VLGFCKGVQSTAVGQPVVLNIMLVTNEAHFHLDDHINRQNLQLWASEIPRLTIANPIHPERAAVWCALSGTRIFSPMFIDGHF